uniref:helix-turn-helix domain-containing protein n=1 Tax=Candidatus Electrothrix sp. TaxID=2170559 RepID=UPI00405700DB
MKTSKIDSPQFALDRLDPARITFARELRGLTKKSLAEKLKKTSSAVSQIERGLIRPDLATFISLSLALGVPPSFFIGTSCQQDRIDMSSCHFRTLRSTSQSLRRQSVRSGDLSIDLIELLESKGVILPPEQVSDFNVSSDNEEHIEQAANNLRHHWGLGLGPIPNITRLLESKGIIILPLPNSCIKVDAYSTWRGKRPCILLSLAKTPSRVRFDVSHELGHLVLHEETSAGQKKSEREANRFAGAFLAPRESFMEECPRRWSLAAFQQLKLRWKISIQALLYRAKDLGCISQSTHQRAMIQLNRYNMRKNEGPEWEMEKPVILGQALELLSDQVTLDQLASELSLFPKELKERLNGYVSKKTLDKISTPNNQKPGKLVSIERQVNE